MIEEGLAGIFAEFRSWLRALGRLARRIFSERYP